MLLWNSSSSLRFNSNDENFTTELNLVMLGHNYNAKSKRPKEEFFALFFS